MKRIVNAFLGKSDGGKRACAALALYAATAMALPAQTFTTLFSFDGTNGEYPFAGLLQATNGDLYGTASEGGAYAAGFNGGTVVKITPSGTLTTLYNFCAQSGCTDGNEPSAGLVQASNGDFYGTASAGGVKGYGTIFKITLGGTLTTLYSFCSRPNCTDGAGPYAGLIQATDGDLYGTTVGSSASEPCADSCGTIFKITRSGTLTTLHRFCSQSGCTDGSYPLAGLVQATNGDIYGTTGLGGDSPGPHGSGAGTVFKITPTGTLTTLYRFCAQSGCPDGAVPAAGLIQATDGDFYGTTSQGGVGGGGTVFKITPSGALTTLYTFCSQIGCTDGAGPLAGLVQATDGNFYGTTSTYGDVSYTTFGGTIFKITPSGAFTTMYSFCAQSGCPDGAAPEAGLVQATNGDLYGTTVNGGGANNYGTLFSLSVGLGPFVETQTTSGKVGAVVKILGTNLTGATSVSFHGTAAVFTVVSPSLITTTVPTGATTGKVKVVTPRRTLSSNVPYRVRP